MPTSLKSPNAEALDKRTMASFIDNLKSSPLTKSAPTRLTPPTTVVTTWQTPANSGDGQGRRPRLPDRVRGHRCKGGNQQLAQRFVTGIGPTKVLTRTIVRAIAVGDSNVRVTLANGKVLEAEHVILTAPPPVWNRIAIDPMLPPGLVPQMGCNVKF
jgi:monoamine oxidase